MTEWRSGTMVLLASCVFWLVTPVTHAVTDDSITAIEHARVHTSDGTVFEDGTVIMRGAKITAVGAAAEIHVPGGVRTIDGRGTWVTPGLIDAEATTGLVDIQLEPATVETGLDERYDAIRAAFSVVDGFNPASVVIAVTRMEGVTASILAPQGGLVAGQGTVVRLAGRGVGGMVVRAPAALYINMGGAGKSAAFGARGGALLRLRELADDVRQYAKRRPDFEKNQMRRVAASRLDLEALIPVIEGRLPVVIDVHRASDIEAALKLAREEKLKIILSGCEEGWMVAGHIAAAGIPVILSPLPDLPGSFETLNARLENAALLDRAGVKIALSPREHDDHASRRLRIEAGNAVANGLPWNKGLRAVTAAPAEIFGVAGELGTIAPGKSADLVLWSGDPFEPLTRVRQVFIRGEEIALRSRQTELRDRYR